MKINKQQLHAATGMKLTNRNVEHKKPDTRMYLMFPLI